MIGIIVTTYNRPHALARSLSTITALGAPVLVVDDGSSGCEPVVWVGPNKPEVLHVPKNRGLAAALNIGLSYWLADKSIQWISYFQDDVEVHPKCLEILSKLHSRGQIFTGHDAGEHAAFGNAVITGVPARYKWAIRATHIHASASFWREQMPIPTNELGTPKRVGTGRGMGSNVDWWIVRDGPRSCKKTNRPIICVPGLVRSFLHKAADSCWNNEARAGEEPPLAQWTN